MSTACSFREGCGEEKAAFKGTASTFNPAMSVKVCAGQDVRSDKEKRYVGNYFDRRLGLDVIWRAAHLASQPAVGVLPEWRTWPDPFDYYHSASAGPDLVGRNVGCQPQKMVQSQTGYEAEPQIC
jgi:hypothetical protein